jgi:hypothetical protein
MSKLTVEQLVSVVVVVPLPFILIWTAIASHLLVSRLEQIFVHSLFMRHDRKLMEKLGLFGKIVTCGSVVLVCWLPRLHIWRGVALESEIGSIPKRLKLWLYPPFIASHLWFSGLLVSGYVFG